MTQAQTMLELADELLSFQKKDGDLALFSLLARAENTLRSQAATTTPPVQAQTMLELAEKILNTSEGTTYPSMASAKYVRNAIEGLARELRRATTAAAQPVTKTDVERVLCCPGGCLRTDDCFVSGNYSHSKREREQANAVIALYANTVAKPVTTEQLDQLQFGRSLHARPAPQSDGVLERCMDMLADVPGATLEERLTHYIGSFMAMQARAFRGRGK
jgi:hypothetical protein